MYVCLYVCMYGQRPVRSDSPALSVGVSVSEGGLQGIQLSPQLRPLGGVVHRDHLQPTTPTHTHTHTHTHTDSRHFKAQATAHAQQITLRAALSG